MVAVAGGLGGCAYLAMESPVAVVAEAWLACAEAAVRVADPGSPGQKILKRLAWGACDVAEGARRWGSRREGPGPAQGGGGDDHSKEGDDGDDASSSFFFGASVAPGDVAWFKTAARLRVTLALTEGAESEEVEGRSTTTRASPSGPSGPSGARDSDSAADSASATAAVVASATAAVIACLDPTAAPYEARHAAMKALRDADASLVRSRLDVRALRRTLATRLLPRETGHGCARRALQLLAAWSPTESPSYVSDEDAESDLEVSSACWDAAAELASASANERVRCAALRCLGAEFGARKKRREKKGTPRRTQGADSTFESAFESFESFAAGASTLAALIVAGSRPERPEDVRRAAADALARSGLLDLETDEREVFFSEEAADSVSAGTTTTRAPSSSSFSSAPSGGYLPSGGPSLGSTALTAWASAFRLMEDEDASTRATAARAAGRAAGAAPDADAETCLRASHRAVSRAFARWPPFERYLLATLGGARSESRPEVHAREPEEAEEEEAAFACFASSSAIARSIAEAATVRRLFDREVDNHHEEGLLLAQLAARAVRERGVVGPKAAAEGLDAALDACDAVAGALEAAAARDPSDASLTRSIRTDSNGFERIRAGCTPSAETPTNRDVGFAPAARAFLAAWAYADAVGTTAEGRDARAQSEIFRARPGEGPGARREAPRRGGGSAPSPARCGTRRGARWSGRRRKEAAGNASPGAARSRA